MSSDHSASTQSVSPPRPPQRELPTIGPFRAVSILGEGGMGIVYLAEQSSPIRRQVALKLVRAGADSKEVVARFERERQALASISHPNVARIFDAGESPDGRPYFAMEYVEGLPITRFCDRHKLPNRKRIELLTEVCDAVQHAHEKGLIHRDIKPSNILVGGTVDRPLAKVIDFGVAKATGPGAFEDTFTTQVGQFVGTPAYMSPEQADLSAKDVDHRTDVYSLGVLMYEVLGGVLPFDFRRLPNPTFPAVQRMISEEDPIAPSARLSSLGGESQIIAACRGTDLHRLRKELRGDLDWIILKALEKHRSRRYETVDALAEDLRRHLRHEPVSAGPPTLRYRAKKFVRRRRRAIAAGSFAGVVLTLAAVAATSFRSARTELANRLFSEAQLAAYSNPAEAVNRLTGFVEHYPAHVEARLELAYLLAREARRDDAKREAQQVLAVAPDSGATHLLLAQLERDRRPDLAEQHRLEASRLLPDDRYYSALSLPKSRSHEAVRLLSELLASDGAHFDARWNRAWRYFDIGDYDAMLRDGELLTTLRPTSTTAWNIHGVALKQLRRLEESLQAFSKAIELSPENGATYLNRADVYRSLERHDLALADCNRAITLEPSFGGAFALRGAVHIANGLGTAALKDCEAAIRLEPTNALAYWTRAQIHKHQDALDLAIEDFCAAAERDPDNADVLLDRGDTYRQLRRYQLAEADYTASLDRLKNPDAFYKRGSVRVNLDNLQGAREDLNSAIQLRPDTAHYYNRRARVLRLLQEYSLAMQDHDKAIALAPTVHDVYANRGITRWFMRDLAGAIEDFQRAADFAGASRSTFHVWLWQLHTSRGEAGLAESAVCAAAEFAVDEWGATIIRVIRGEGPPETLLSMAKDDGRLTDAYYYIGAKALAGGDVSGAHAWFQKCIALQYVDFSEYDLAILHVSLTDTPELPRGG